VRGGGGGGGGVKGGGVGVGGGWGLSLHTKKCICLGKILKMGFSLWGQIGASKRRHGICLGKSFFFQNTKGLTGRGSWRSAKHGEKRSATKGWFFGRVRVALKITSGEGSF